jgi:hypothetical protein
MTQPDSGITEKAPNPPPRVDSDRPEALWRARSSEYHRCHRTPCVVLRAGVREVRRKERIAVHDNHGSLCVIKRTVCFSEAAAGPEQGCFTGKAKLDIARTRGF